MASGFKANVGSTDRLIRLIAGALVVLAAIVFYGSLGGIGTAVLAVVGAVLILTAAVRFCPAYLPLGLSTCKTKG